MISSLFGKTKPINYIFLLVFLFGFYWIVHLFLFQRRYAPDQLVEQALILGCLMFTIFLVDFIVKRNKLSRMNTLSLMYYTLLIVVFPEVLIDPNSIFCSFFLLLSVRRILSLKSLKDIKLKLFDATLWIMVASLFYEWALLYLILIFVAIYFYDAKNIRNWLIPFVAVITFALIAVAILVLRNDPYYLFDHYDFNHDFSSVFFFDWGNSLILVFYVALVLLSGFMAYLKLGTIGVGKLVTMRLVLLLFVIGLVINLLNSTAENHPILITFFPAMVFITTYVETIKKDRIKEMVLLVSMILPFFVLITNILLK